MNELHLKIGELLKTERERQKIELEDLAERLKIALANLEAIERGDAKALPSELYFSLFSKSYAESLGIDYSRTVDAINADLENGSPAINETAKEKKNDLDKSERNQTGDESNSSDMIKKVSYFAGAIVVIFLIFLTVNKFFFSSDEITTDEPTVVQNDDSIINKNNEQLKAAYTDYNWDETKYDKPEKLKLTLIPSQESWSTVLADGDTVIYRVLRPGRTYEAEADYRLLVSVGIPSVVTIKLNGELVNLQDEQSRRISRVLINQMNLDKFILPSKSEISSPPPKTTSDKSSETEALDGA